MLNQSRYKLTIQVLTNFKGFRQKLIFHSQIYYYLTTKIDHKYFNYQNQKIDHK